MPRVDPELWRQLDAHLDEVLDTPSGERASWLAALRARDPQLAAELESVLDEHRRLAAHGFLERGPDLPATVVSPAGPLGAYTLRSRIGQGGMGSVWLAERSDGRFEGQVAIKLLNPALVGLAAEERMKREGTILGALNHPHIARLMDAGVSPQRQPYLILEYVDGRHIDEHCREQRLGVAASVRLFLDVLSAVAYAHTHLIVHRDIKPSNVLVHRDGRVKLLDFGIAKLLEGEATQGLATLSHEAGSPLTPGYAAPEQITGGAITTATDVYALGVLLYLLLTGRHPTGEPSTPMELMRAIVDTEPLPASEAAPDPLRRQLRGDLDTIICKALKKAPAERYTSVVAFADDLGRYLQLQPIRARPDATLYRAGKFVRRNRWWLAGAALTVTGLSTGLVVANHQRAIAQKRFFEVRQLAGKLFDVDVQVRQLPGASKARQLIVDTSLEYLQRLAVDAENDPELALEVGTAYMRSARVQGVPISPNLGQLDAAEQSLITAQRFIDSVLAGQPDNRTAILRSGQIAHDRMILAGLKHLEDRAIELAATSLQRLEEYLGKGSLEVAEADQVLLAYMNVANRYMVAGHLDEALRMSQRTIDLALANDKPIQAGAAQLVVALALRKRGELEQALRVVHEAEAVLRPTQNDTSNLRVTRFALALIREGMILGDDTGPNLGQPDEAIVVLERAFHTVEELARQDESDVQPSGMMATAGLHLARLLRTSDPARTLSVCDAILHALANKQNNPRARREEISALAASTYALRHLGRTKEAKGRLDDAFERLRQANSYPVTEIELGSETDDALSALADQRAATGDVPGAIELYRELLDKGLVKRPALEPELEDAAELSRVYDALIGLQHRQGRNDLAAPLEAARTQLWQGWRDRLPQNGYVLRQLARRD
jgi:tetratricopeptide (TPR) repeat protein